LSHIFSGKSHPQQGNYEDGIIERECCIMIVNEFSGGIAEFD
jgi:hypothetical protein